jgi:hypothetical protein
MYNTVHKVNDARVALCLLVCTATLQQPVWPSEPVRAGPAKKGRGNTRTSYTFLIIFETARMENSAEFSSAPIGVVARGVVPLSFACVCNLVGCGDNVILGKGGRTGARFFCGSLHADTEMRNRPLSRSVL